MAYQYGSAKANWKDREHISVQRHDIERLKAESSSIIEDDYESDDDIESSDEDSQESFTPPKTRDLLFASALQRR